MKADYINPFLTALASAFDTMLGCSVTRTDLTLKSSNVPTFDVSGIIGLSGKAMGTVVLSVSKNVAVKATSVMLMVSEEDVTDEEIVDAIGELANMVAGAAKSTLEQYELSVSLPTVISGTPHAISFPSNVSPICVRYESDWGPLTLEVGMTSVPAAVAS